MTQNKLITVQEFARLARVEPSTIRHWRSTGVGPKGHKPTPRGKILYNADEVAKFLKLRIEVAA